MIDFQRSTALVTGASSGIGAAFVRALAARKTDVVLVARSTDKLEKLANEVRTKHGVRAEVVTADLARPGAARAVAARVAELGLEIDILVNDAGFATYGRFEEIPFERQHEEMMVNVVALVELTHAFLPGMVARGRGGILQVASTAAFQPVPYMATYAATKAFVLSLSEALWAENRARGVRVLAVCPGATETPFFDVVRAEEASVGARETPEIVVDRALAAFAAGRSHVVSGRKNALLANLSRLLPRATVASVTERLMRPRASLAAGDERKPMLR